MTTKQEIIDRIGNWFSTYHEELSLEAEMGFDEILLPLEEEMKNAPVSISTIRKHW